MSAQVTIGERVWRVIRAIVAVVGVFGLYQLRKFLEFRRRMNAMFPGPEAAVLMGNFGDLQQFGLSHQFFEWLHSHSNSGITRFWVGPRLNISVTGTSVISELVRKTKSAPSSAQSSSKPVTNSFGQGECVTSVLKRYSEQVGNDSALARIHDRACATLLRQLPQLKWGQEGGSNLFQQMGSLVRAVLAQALFGDKAGSSPQAIELMDLHQKVLVAADKWSIYPIPPYWEAGYRSFLADRKELGVQCRALLDAEKDSKVPTLLRALLSVQEDNADPVVVMLRFLDQSCGHTHAALFWALFNLAKHQDVQAKLFAEITDNYGRKLAPTASELRELPFLDAVLFESMRLRCSTVQAKRHNPSETFRLGDSIIPRGTNIYVPVFISMRDEVAFGPDPDHFVPERFLGDSPHAEQARSNFAILGAADGTNASLGFAQAELRAVLCTIMQRFVIKLKNPAETGVVRAEAGITCPLEEIHFVLQPHPKESHDITIKPY